MAAKQPWIIGQKQADDGDRTRTGDRRILEDLLGMASTDVELARLAVSVPWFVDGVTYHEAIVLRWLGAVANKDIRLASLIASFPWFVDEPFGGRDVSVALRLLVPIASTNIELARTITELWLADGVSSHEANALESVNGLASKDIALARGTAVLSWSADGVNEEEEQTALRLLDILAASDIELARRIAGFSWFAKSGTFASYVLNSLVTLANREMEILTKLTDQPWFADGLDEEEAALLVTLGWVASRSSELYDNLLQTHYTQYRTASLPMAGDVNIWVFQNTPFPPDDTLLNVIEDTARISEQFLRVPFPTTDIILLVVENIDGGYGFYSAKHLGSFMVATRRQSGVRSVRHETAHYYFRLGPQWLSEGGAEFIVTYVKDRTGVQSISDRISDVAEEIQSQCFQLNEIENIRHYAYVWGREPRHICPYAMGENLLLNIFETFGEDLLAPALRELYGLMLGRGSFGGGERDMEALVFDTFAKHVPTERLEEFLDFYRRLHGGPYEDPGVGYSDDHGGEAAAATEIAVEEVITGRLDYHFDFDYFKFRAEAGHRYRIRVNHAALRSTSVILYGSDGMTRERFVEKWTDEGPASCAAFQFQRTGRMSYGAQMRWITPSSGDYYLAVHNFAGKSGQYTLVITPVTTIQDDHGDSVATASDLTVGRIVDGVVDYDFDLDFFRVQAVEGRKYSVTIDTAVSPFFADLYHYSSEGITPTQWLASDHHDGLGGGGSFSSEWVAPNSGEYYFVAGGSCGTVGTYRIIVAESDSS